MITTDGPDSADQLLHGSQGSFQRSVSGELPLADAVTGKVVKVTVTKLLGGHSGNDIHLQRLNANLALAALAKAAVATPDLGIVSAVSGDLGGLNKIPNSLELTLVAPEGLDVADLRATSVSAGETVCAARAAHPIVSGRTKQWQLRQSRLSCLSLDCSSGRPVPR